MREKLIRLLDLKVDDDWYTNYEIADHLIANDVVFAVRCKDCKHCRTASWGEKFCTRKQLDGVYAELSNLRDDDFCSYGERKDN